MDVNEYKRMNNIVVNSATNGWRALIYKFFDEHKNENEEVILTNPIVIAYTIENYIVYPKKLFRDKDYRISMLRNIEDNENYEIDEDNVINISQLSLEELNGFSHFLLDFLQGKIIEKRFGR